MAPKRNMSAPTSGLSPKKGCGPNQPLLGDSHGHGDCHQHAHNSGCTSHAHQPGMCHGFEAKPIGNWKVVHDAGDLILGSSEERKKKAFMVLGASAAVSFVVTVAELLLGFMTGSLALYSDGAHQLSDVFFYAGLLGAAILSEYKGNSADYSFGYHRAQVLGAVVALLLQYFITALVVSEAIRRLAERGDRPVDGMVVCLTALVTICTNVVLLRLNPSHGHGHSHGAGDSSAEGVARLHMIADLLQGAVCATVGAIMWVDPETSWLDSLSALFYACAVAFSTFRVFQELMSVLMERAPPELQGNEIFNDLARIKGVIDVHCCHVWALGPGKIAMSAHLHIEEDQHEDVLHNAQIIVKHKYGIIHSTLQVSEDEDNA